MHKKYEDFLDLMLKEGRRFDKHTVAQELKITLHSANEAIYHMRREPGYCYIVAWHPAGKTYSPVLRAGDGIDVPAPCAMAQKRAMQAKEHAYDPLVAWENEVSRKRQKNAKAVPKMPPARPSLMQQLEAINGR